MQVDFGRTASDYGTHRAGFPEEFFLRAQELGVGLQGQSLLDLGTGTGALAREFAKRGCSVTGLDISQNLLDEAARLAQKEQLSIRWQKASGEETGFEASSFDVVSAGQCWHWFSREEAAREVYRLVRPGGSLLIAHFDWLTRPANIVERSVHLALKHRDAPSPAALSVGTRGTYTLWLEEVEAVGFTEVETFSFDVGVPYSRASWRGRMRASALIGATMPTERVQAFDDDLAALLSQQYPERFLVPHRVFAIIAKKNGA